MVENNKFGAIWHKRDPDLFVFNEDTYICHTYIPAVYSDVLNENDIDFLRTRNRVWKSMVKLEKTFISGDLNSGAGKLPNILEPEENVEVLS